MSNKDHTKRAHALLSASGSHRWMNCTPSARLEDGVAETGTSTFAQEGTFAHELAEICLLTYKEELTLEQFKEQRAALAQKIDKYNKSNGTNFDIDSIEEYVDKYVENVCDDYETCLLKDPHAQLLVEMPFDLTDVVPDGFGTNDAIVIAEGEMHVHDLKFGRGVRVEAENNPQLMLYAYGAFTGFDSFYDIQRITLHIGQPRLDSFPSWELSADDLKNWIEQEVRPKAKLAFAGEGKFSAGDWCHFCKVKARCRHLAEANLSLAKHEFSDPPLLTDDEVADILQKIPQFENWTSSVRQYAYEQAVTYDKKWPSFKLVEAKTNRKFSDEQAVSDALSLEGFEEDKIYSKKLKGLGAIEKLVGKDRFAPLLGSFVVKPEGQPTLVPESDKRPELTRGCALEQAKKEFAD